MAVKPFEDGNPKSRIFGIAVLIIESPLYILLILLIVDYYECIRF